jgi:hypothetical protein
MTQSRSLFGPLLLIAAGTLWLLTKSGSVPTSNLWALTHIWPYFLIAAGVGLILRSYWQYANMLLDIVIIGGAMLSILYAPKLGWDNPSMAPFFFNSTDFHVGPTVRGSGEVVTEMRDVSDFTGIKLDYPAQVTVSQGKAVSVKIEAEDNVLPGLQTRVLNNRLEIFYKAENGKYVTPTHVVKITIVVKDLKEVDFGSAGDLTVNGLETDNLNISLSGAGNLKVSDLVAKKFGVDLSGAGSITADGEADDFKLNISGFGSCNGGDLQTNTADVNLSGAGSAILWVEDKLNAHLSGVGSVNYYGSPTVTKNVSGLGGVSKSGNK